MAKLFASETAMQIALDAVRIHSGYGYSTEFDVERYFCDAPLVIVGESQHPSALRFPSPMTWLVMISQAAGSARGSAPAHPRALRRHPRMAAGHSTGP